MITSSLLYGGREVSAALAAAYDAALMAAQLNMAVTGFS